MAESTLIRCSRCDQHLMPDCFFPSNRRPGDWCRSCRRSYMAEYMTNNPEMVIREKARKAARVSRNAARARKEYLKKLDAFKKRESKIPPRRPQGNEWKELRRSVIDAETHCGICGEVVDKSLTGIHKLGPTVDHIIPLEFGGDYYDRDNLRLAHFGCNARQGQKQLKQRYLALTAEVEALKVRVAELEGGLHGQLRLVV